VEGKYKSAEGVVVETVLQHADTYSQEICVPWATLGLSAKTGTFFGMMPVINDGDKNRQPAKWSWETRAVEPWKATSHYKKTILADSFKFNDSLLMVPATNTPMLIDGVPEKAWKKCPWINLSHLLKGLSYGAGNPNAKMKILWDKNYLYFYIKVQDDLISLFNHTFSYCDDYGLIENQQKDKAEWIMLAEEAKHAGGFYKNYIMDTTLLLPPGYYSLVYLSNNKHAPGGWYGEAPALPFYGAMVFKNSEANENE